VFYAFEDDPSVIFADMHEDGEFLYPGTGASHETGQGAAVGAKLNICLPPGADDAAFAASWRTVLAHIERFEPQFILLQCGADSIGGDPIAHLALTPASHGLAARDLRELAERLGHGKVLASGGGGYDRRNLALAWNAVVEELL
jgi:acetoin utilization protein AcuC